MESGHPVGFGPSNVVEISMYLRYYPISRVGLGKVWKKEGGGWSRKATAVCPQGPGIEPGISVLCRVRSCTMYAWLLFLCRPICGYSLAKWWRHTVATGSQYFCYAPVLHWFLCCDRFNCGSRQVKHELVDLITEGLWRITLSVITC